MLEREWSSSCLTTKKWAWRPIFYELFMQNDHIIDFHYLFEERVFIASIWCTQQFQKLVCVLLSLLKFCSINQADAASSQRGLKFVGRRGEMRKMGRSMLSFQGQPPLLQRLCSLCNGDEGAPKCAIRASKILYLKLGKLHFWHKFG